jgi:uncharacterized protein (UPF0261 family)
MDPYILILVMAEEKWEEAYFLQEKIQSSGHSAKILDMGLIAEARGECDFTREEIIAASGKDSEEINTITDRGKRMPIIVAGARKRVLELYTEGQLTGVVSIGGTTGTQMGTQIMKVLPFGFPKLAVSSTASLRGFASRYIGTADIALLHSVVEIAGLNKMVKNVLSRAAGAVCGMVEAGMSTLVEPAIEGETSMIAITHFGPCELCANEIRILLEQRGYEVVGFSAAGVGDKALEEIIDNGNLFSAVIDLAPGGVGEELLGFARRAGPNRLEGAGRVGIPQIIATCGVNFGSPLKRRYKPEYESRKRIDYDSARTFVRLSLEELRMVAVAMAEKLNKARGPVKVVIPLGGWSSLDRKDTSLYDGEADRVFVNELKKQLRRDIEVREVEYDLETPEFAAAVVEAFDQIMQAN